MKNYVTTLPISVKTNPTLSLAVSPYIAELLVQNLWYEGSIISMNLIGEKFSHMADKELTNNVSEFGNTLKDFWIRHKFQRIDKENVVSLKEIFRELFEKGIVVEKEIIVKVCKCGLSESLENAENFGAKKKLIDEGCCKKCNYELSSEKTRWLIYLPPLPETIRISPVRYHNHITNYVKNQKEKMNQLLISRKRNTGISYEINGNFYNIDVDFFRTLWLIDLERKWLDPSIVVANPSWLYSTYLWWTLYESFTKKPVQIVVHPYLGVNSKEKEVSEKGFKHQNFLLKDIIENWQEKIMQLFIATGLKRWMDETKTDEWFMKKSLEALKTYRQGEKNIIPMEKLEYFLKGNDVVNALNGYKGNKTLTQAEIDTSLHRFLL